MPAEFSELRPLLVKITDGARAPAPPRTLSGPGSIGKVNACPGLVSTDGPLRKFMRSEHYFLLFHKSPFLNRPIG